MNAARLVLRRLPDRGLATAGGWPIHSPEVERWWLPKIGPSTFVLARHLDAALGDSDIAAFNAADVAQRVGLGGGKLRETSPLGRALLRLGRYGFAFAKLHDDNFGPEWRIAIASHVPPPPITSVDTYPYPDRADFVRTVGATRQGVTS